MPLTFLRHWLHERRRQADRFALIPAIREAAEHRASLQFGRFTPEWLEEVDRLRGEMWALHMWTTTDDHWTCPCATGDREQ